MRRAHLVREVVGADVRVMLERERWRLDSLVDALLEHETLDQDRAYEAAGLPTSSPAEESLASR